MPPHVIVLGASAGGVQALREVLSCLPATLPAAVLVAMHTSSNGSGALPEILARSTALPVAFATTGDQLESGRVYVARPDFHLLVTSGGLRVVHGPRENGFRPAVDPLFRTAARTFGARVIGVVLSGALADGTYGLSVIKHYGGIAIAQDPDDAAIASMPLSAIEYVDVDYVLPARKIGQTLVDLANVDDEPEGDPEMPGRMKVVEPQLSGNTEVSQMLELFGPPSGLTCPDCGGALWEVEEDGVLRYQCHVGHQYAPENLEEGQRDSVDGALWSAVRVLEEHAALKMRMADRASSGGLSVVSQGFAEGARDAQEQAERIRAVLLEIGNGNESTATAGKVGSGASPRAVIQAAGARARSRARGGKSRPPSRKTRR